MKKTTTYLLLLMFLCMLSGTTQVLQEQANWPNTSWNISGSYFVSAGLFEANPLINPNFSYDDYASGASIPNQIGTESPVIDLTPAFTAGENLIYVETSYVYNKATGDQLTLEYYDADLGSWVIWHTFSSDTPSAPTDNYCSGTYVDFQSANLNIENFSANQLSNFQYRFYFNDNNTWAYGFCIGSPTIYSDIPPACPDPSGLTVESYTDTTVTLSWTQGSSESSWEVAVVTTGNGTPTTAGTPALTNSNFEYSALSPTTTYDVYIRANCSGAYSNWIGPVTFTTDDWIPSPPTGVTCSGTNSTIVFQEEFINDSGWTGDINSGNGSWEIPNDSGTVGTGPSSAYSGSSFMNFEASGTNTTGRIVSPEIDLTNATGETELAFYMHAYGSGMGTLEVGIGTSQTGPFTNIMSWSGQYQTYASEDWLPIGLDITAYIGQPIFIEFKQTPTGNPYGDMSIDALTVEACGNFCSAPANFSITDITQTSVDFNWTPGGTESAWEYMVQPSGAGDPTTNGTETLATSVNNYGGLSPNTEYEIYVRSKCDTNFYSNWIGPYTFTTDFQTDYTVNCSVGPTNINYCYENDTTILFNFTASDPAAFLEVVFNDGTIYTSGDLITIYDYDGTSQLYQGSGDLTGLTATANGNQLFIEITSNSTISCASGEVPNSLDFDVSCLTCLSPEASYTVISDCSVSQDYTIEVDLSSMGSASSLTITDDYGSTPQIATAIGTYTFGPYVSGTSVVYTISNADHPECNITSTSLLQNDCPPMIVSTYTYTVEELITDVLINTACSDAYNISWSTGTNFGSENGIGYFSGAYNFPLQEGIILTSGNASSVVGPNNSIISSGTNAWPGDADLEAISNAGSGMNASYIEFDFIPQVEHISFDYIFASEEYTSNYECNYSDIFAFILTDQNGIATNLAVVPGTNIPVTVVNVHGGIGTCGPANADYFDTYNAFGQGEIDFNGQTVVLTAESDVIPGQTYHLKLAIQDDGDNLFDSAVFLGSQTLNLGFCPPDNNFICSATELTTLPITSAGSVDGTTYTLLTAFGQNNEPVGSCYTAGLDATIWFEFTAPPTGEVLINTYMPTGATTNAEFAVYEANGTFDCTDITTLGNEVGCASGNTSLNLNGANALTPGETYYIQVNNPGDALDTFGIEVLYYDCTLTSYTQPTIVPDCTNDQFYITLDVTDLGNGTPVLTDGTNTYNVSIGSIQIGPYANGTTVDLTMLHGLVSDCDINMGSFYYACPPDCTTNVTLTEDSSCGNYPIDITWDSVAFADGYYLTIGTTSGGTNVLDNLDVGNITSYELTDVNTATTYYVTLTPYTVGGSATGCPEYTVTTNSTTCYCESIPTSNDAAGITQLDIEGSVFAIPDVTNYEITTPVSLYQGASSVANITFATGVTYNTNIWIDFNDDYVFDTSELVYSGESTDANPTILNASMYIPDGTLGQHRMRIGTADTGQATPDPCYSGSEGVTIDVMVAIIPIPCSAASFGTTNITPDCDNNQYFVDVFITGLGNGTPAITDGTTTWPVNNTGAMQVGPFADASSVNLTLEHGTDITCDVDMGTFTYTCPFICTPTTYNTIAVNADCNNTQFYVDIDITDLGNGTPTITDGTTTWNVTSTGMMQVGPFADASSVDLTLEHGIDSVCDIDLGTFTHTCCIPAAYSAATVTEDCSNMVFYIDIDITALGNGTPSITNGSATWPVTALGTMQLGPFAYTTTIDLTLQHGTDSTCDVDMGSYSYNCSLACTPITYNNATVTEDCVNSEYYVDIDITGLGTETSAVSDGTNTWPITTTGTMQVGPFATGTTANLTIVNNSDSNCNVSLGTYTYTCPFVCSPAAYATAMISEDCT
ncbi:choice-of-anchor L domain-containing protein, partial [Neptunitalea chrysea]|uniref:choice-of-anchor L domain-containing protein n=1 Tax=Neptunitalea chrysea TaxID=1647581 RepID=UPI002493AD9E